tara:strand:+ start:21742 stop:22824 length:1083 start_codon:yes stop_codon:yes gene_type:complete
MEFILQQLRQVIPEPTLMLEFLGNTVLEYIVALGAFVLFFVIFLLVQQAILGRLAVLAKKTKTDIDDALIRVVKSLKPPFYYFVAFYLALQFLVLNELFSDVVNVVLVIWIIYQAVIGLQIVIDYGLEKRSRKEDAGTKAAYGYLGRLIKWVLWAVAALLVLSNLGVNITSLVAGLGIGGIAIAFALQNILGDLFSSFAIYFDKPFVVGDFIVVGDKMGNVEKIGIKTTRIRALQGEELVISNKELTSARVQNFKKLKERRVVFSFGVLYETPSEKVKKISDIVRNIFDGKKDKIRFDRVHFKNLGDSALEFEVVYYVLSSDYADYMDLQQDINFDLMEVFKKEGIEFAYPTQTLYVSKS